jgi:hypothetical protein
MKLYIYEDNSVVEKKFWLNFRESVLSQEGYKLPADILFEEYNSRLLFHELGAPYILFQSEKDATMFLLRWS